MAAGISYVGSVAAQNDDIGRLALLLGFAGVARFAYVSNKRCQRAVDESFSLGYLAGRYGDEGPLRLDRHDEHDEHHTA